MSKISIVIFPDAEKWLRENLSNFSWDGIARVRPSKPMKKGNGFYAEYEDVEEDQKKPATMKDHVKALQLLCEQVGHTLFVGGIRSPLELLDAGNWDVEVIDAFFQFVMLGKVVYG